MPTLFVKCKQCGTEFPTPMGETNPGLSGLLISGLRLRCTACGTEDDYSTLDFHVSADMPDSSVGSSDPAQADLTAEHTAKLAAAQEKAAGFGVVPPESRPPHES